MYSVAVTMVDIISQIILSLDNVRWGRESYYQFMNLMTYYGVQEPGGGRLFRASSDPNLRKEGTVRLEPGDPSHGLTPQYAARSQVSATCISF